MFRDWLWGWGCTGVRVMRDPEQFFAEVDSSAGYRRLVAVAVTSYVIAGLVTASVKVLVVSFEVAIPFRRVLLEYGFELGQGVVAGTAGVFLGAAILHTGVRFAGGGEGFRRTVGIVAYISPVAVILKPLVTIGAFTLGYLPVVGASGYVVNIAYLVFGIVLLAVTGYMAYMGYCGVRQIHGISRGRAVAAELSGVVVIGLVLAAAVVGGTVLLDTTGGVVQSPGAGGVPVYGFQPCPPVTSFSLATWDFEVIDWSFSGPTTASGRVRPTHADLVVDEIQVDWDRSGVWRHTAQQTLSQGNANALQVTGTPLESGACVRGAVEIVYRKDTDNQTGTASHTRPQDPSDQMRTATGVVQGRVPFHD